MNPYGYSEAVWRLFQQTPRAGVLVGEGVLATQVTAPASQSVLELQLRLDGGQVGEARFRALGCPTTIAVGAWLAEQAGGKPLAEFGRIGSAQIRQALDIPEDRIHCALLGEDAVRALLQQVK